MYGCVALRCACWRSCGLKSARNALAYGARPQRKCRACNSLPAPAAIDRSMSQLHVNLCGIHFTSTHVLRRYSKGSATAVLNATSGELTVSVSVANTGARDGDEIVQVRFYSCPRLFFHAHACAPTSTNARIPNLQQLFTQPRRFSGDLRCVACRLGCDLAGVIRDPH